ncbi:MAPEG family protein [Sphingomonas sp. HF-S3]|uniref:MAPEG family protein n=1 Tax=Sphingomonas rustica TaxID=3103142 RepID=A0ABV0BEX7_9SPHN
MTLLPVTLTAAGAAALINLWLGVRIGRIRIRERISVGDGGNDRLNARMRAHSNFAEYVPLVLILIGLLELALGTSLWLWIAAALFILGRVAHPFGMDGFMPARQFGAATTMLGMLALGIAAIVTAWY